MMGGYASLTWINDKDGKEYVCYLEDVKEFKKGEGLGEELKRRCTNVSGIVGTERW